MKAGHCIHHPATSQVKCVSVSSDQRVGASGSDDKQVKLWDLSRVGHKSVHTFSDHLDVVSDVSFGPDGYILAACSHDTSIKLWDVRMCRLLQHYNAHTDVVRCASESCKNAERGMCRCTIHVAHGHCIVSGRLAASQGFSMRECTEKGPYYLPAQALDEQGLWQWPCSQ